MYTSVQTKNSVSSQGWRPQETDAVMDKPWDQATRRRRRQQCRWTVRPSETPGLPSWAGGCSVREPSIRGRVSDFHFDLAALHDLSGMKAGQSTGIILCRSPSEGGINISWSVVKCISETRPTVNLDTRIAYISPALVSSLSSSSCRKEWTERYRDDASVATLPFSRTTQNSQPVKIERVAL